ncbi:MAG: NUDIX hydrolase [Candidatus Rokuibacteriota bacterium]|nr:MAG: NUDIX hydrolase [Candidatus Rokubacteria bacterium]PYN56067.1 MAG: NUDIX hydrolase [Candidatus Rokubacteria bacterium]
MARRPHVTREYPDYPRVGVGAVILHEDKVLLVRRGQSPSFGKWSLPGGLVELGESTREAIAREIMEECGIGIRVVDVAGVLDRVVHDDAGRVRYHYVLVDYLAYPESLDVVAGSDAGDAQWFDIERVAVLDTTQGLLDMIRRGEALRRTEVLRGGDSE